MGLALPGCGGSHQSQAASHPRTAGTAEEVRAPATGQQSRREAPSRAVRAYVSAVNARDGRRLCSLLARDALRGLPLKRRASGCASSLKASIGQPGRHGEPAWRSCRLVAIRPPEYQGRIARMTVSLRHSLAGSQGEVPAEQDVVYLKPVGDSWSVAKASALLYRAVGVGDVPLEALQPPDDG